MKIVLISSLLIVSGLATSARAEDQARGKVVYDKFCSHCHNPGNWAAFKLTQRNGEKLAILDQRTDLSSALVMAAIRNGIGNMPPYRLTELGNADAQAVALDKAKAAGRAADDYVHENPWRSVGIAAGAGLIIGLLIGRR